MLNKITSKIRVNPSTKTFLNLSKWVLLVGRYFMMFWLTTHVVVGQNTLEDSLAKQGQRLFVKGHYQQALKTIKALLTYQKQHYTTNHLKLAQTYTTLGRISFRQNQNQNALRYFEQALQIQLTHYSYNSAHNTYLYLNLSTTHQKMGNDAQAIIYAKKALRSDSKGSLYLHYTLGTSYYGAQKYDSALHHYKKALAFKKEFGVLTNIGNTYLKLEQPAKALEYYHQIAKSSLPFYSQIKLLYLKAKAWQAQVITLQKVAEKLKTGKTKTLRFLQQADSLLQLRQGGLPNEKDKLVLGQWVEAFTKLGATVSNYLYEQATTQPVKDYWLNKLFYFSERQKANVLLHNITGSATTAPIRLSQIQQRLNDSTAILEYCFGKDALYAFAITKERVLLKKLPKDSVVKHWQNYNIYLYTLRVVECVKYTHQMYQWLVKPLYPIVGKKKRWLVIGGVLNILPFDTFCTKLGIDTRKVNFLDINYQAFPYLIWHHTISYATSATLAFLKRPPRRYVRQFLGIAPGTYQDTTEYRTLPYAPQEVTNIAQMVPQPKYTLLGKAATRQRIIKEGANTKWLHFATHGISHQKVDLNGLQLYEGQWLVKDLQPLKFHNDLVVLSSCSAISGRFIQGEGRLAMPRSFLRAGARNILYTLWSVNDRLAARMMTSFYKYLMQGLDYAAALRKAKLEFLNDPKPMYGYPSLWGVFLLEGRL